MANEKSQRHIGKRPGRKPSKVDHRARLERSRQSARECRARKKLRYQYLEELVSTREKAVFSLREELDAVGIYWYIYLCASSYIFIHIYVYSYVYIYNSKSLDVVQSLYFGSKLPSSGTYK